MSDFLSDAVAWAVVGRDGGIHRVRTNKDSAERCANEWRKTQLLQGYKEWECSVEPLVFPQQDSRRCIAARNALNAALHGDGALIDDLETAVANACVKLKQNEKFAELRAAAEYVLDAFESLGRIKTAESLLAIRGRCEMAMLKLRETLNA